MFANRKIKAAIAFISVIMLVLTSTISAIAAPFSYINADAVREKALGKYLSSGDTISVDAQLTDNGENKVVGKKSGIATETVTEEVSFNIVKKLNPMLGAGTIQTVQEGLSGEKKITYNVKYEKGVEVSREVVEEEFVTEPVDKIVEYGNKDAAVEAPVSTGITDYKYVITCEATAYDLSAEENGGYAGQTATGVPLDKGVIAVDPKVIPLGSRVYIEAIDGSWSYGYAVAADTGGAIKGKRVDLCFRTRSECIQFGRKQCRVYVLN